MGKIDHTLMLITIMLISLEKTVFSYFLENLIERVWTHGTFVMMRFLLYVLLDQLLRECRSFFMVNYGHVDGSEHHLKPNLLFQILRLI